VSCLTLKHNKHYPNYSSALLEDVCRTVRPMLSDRWCPVLFVLFCLSVTLMYCGQTVGWMKLGLEVDLGPGHIRWGSSSPQRSTEVGLLPRRHCVRWRPSSPPQKKGGANPQFSAMSIVPNGWMHQDTTWYGGRPWPMRLCVRWGSSFPLKGEQPPIFGPCLLWPNGRPFQLLPSSCYSYLEVPVICN